MIPLSIPDLLVTFVLTHLLVFTGGVTIGRVRTIRQERVEAASHYRQLEEEIGPGTIALAPVPPQPLPRVSEVEAAELWLFARQHFDQRLGVIRPAFKQAFKGGTKEGLSFAFIAIVAMKEAGTFSFPAFQPFHEAYLQRKDAADAAALAAWEQSQAQAQGQEQARS